MNHGIKTRLSGSPGNVSPDWGCQSVSLRERESERVMWDSNETQLSWGGQKNQDDGRSELWVSRVSFTLVMVMTGEETPPLHLHSVLSNDLTGKWGSGITVTRPLRDDVEQIGEEPETSLASSLKLTALLFCMITHRGWKRKKKNDITDVKVRREIFTSHTREITHTWKPGNVLDLIWERLFHYISG